MRIEVDDMQGVITSLDKEVYGITDQVNNITGQMQLLDPAVQHIGRDVNRMSGQCACSITSIRLISHEQR